MAEAPGHLLGQLIGGTLELATEPVLRDIASKHGFHVDAKGARPGVRDGRLLSLLDSHGNKHDLDFVIERGDTQSGAGAYVAFVECAWRRFTKHSKAKAQEIQGAVLPLISRWAAVGPVPAAIVAGRWSRPSIKQLETSGFVILQLDFDTTVEVFGKFGINIKGPENVQAEKVPDSFWAAQVHIFQQLSDRDLTRLSEKLRQANGDDFVSFAAELVSRIVRTVAHVKFHPVHGRSYEMNSIEEAISAVHAYDLSLTHPLIRYEFEVVYTNQDIIKGSYSSLEAAEDFLRRLL